jgi:TolA-binding protein
MTPEELNRMIEFIIASQARLAAAQEQDRQNCIEFQEWSKSRDAKLEAKNDRLERLITRVVRMQDQQAQLLIHQSERMDRFEKFHEESSRDMRQILHLLHTILDRLPPGLTQAK